MSLTWPGHKCPSGRDHTPSVRLASPFYSQWDSAAAPCAPGHPVPRIQQQPAEPPVTGRPPNPTMESSPGPNPPAWALAFTPLGFSAQQQQKSPPPPRGPPPPLCCLHRRGPKMVSMSCWRRPEQGWAASVVGTPRRLGCCHLYWNPPLLGSGGVHTLLCTSQGLVMAERSQAVIIMALDTRTPSVSLKPLMAMHTS